MEDWTKIRLSETARCLFAPCANVLIKKRKYRKQGREEWKYYKNGDAVKVEFFSPQNTLDALYSLFNIYK